MDVLLVLGIPIEEEQQRIDLIVIAAMGKGKELGLKICEPRCLYREQDATRFEASLVTAEPGLLVGIRPAASDFQMGLFVQELD